MPGHEIWKGLDLARRFHDACTSYLSGHLCQLAGHSEDHVGSSDGKDRGHKEWKTKSDTTLDAELGERPIHPSLLTLQRFDQGVGKLQILLQRKTTGANPLSGAHKANKV
jgi:hypothetical protein